MGKIYFRIFGVRLVFLFFVFLRVEIIKKKESTALPGRVQLGHCTPAGLFKAEARAAPAPNPNAPPRLKIRAAAPPLSPPTPEPAAPTPPRRPSPEFAAAAVPIREVAVGFILKIILFYTKNLDAVFRSVLFFPLL